MGQQNIVQPNIILLTVDCWRGDHIGVAENSKAATPHLDRLARQSHYFSQAYSCGGWTKIAMTALFSSTYASMYGFTQGKMSEERPLLAEQLTQAGYNTAGFTTNLVCGSLQGFNRGFNHFKDLRPTSEPPKWAPSRWLRKRGLNRSKKVHQALTAFGINSRPSYPSVTSDELVDEGLQWLTARQQSGDTSPYFLWLHFMDLHWPYRSSSRKIEATENREMWLDRSHWHQVKQSRGTYYPGDQRAERWKQLYSEETASLDKSVGRFLDQVKETEDWDNTLLCVTSDHAEELYEHGSWAHSWNKLHAEGTHVPLIIKTPNQQKPVRHDSIVSHLDVTPTLLDLAGVKKDPQMMGQSLMPDLQSQQNNQPISTPPVMAEMLGHRNSYKYRLAINYLGYRYLYDGDSSSCELFFLEEDPDCQSNLYQKDLDIARQFDQLRLSHISKGTLDVLKGMTILGEDEILYDLDDDPAVVERLKALGYL